MKIPNIEHLRTQLPYDFDTLLKYVITFSATFLLIPSDPEAFRLDIIFAIFFMVSVIALGIRTKNITINYATFILPLFLLWSLSFHTFDLISFFKLCGYAAFIHCVFTYFSFQQSRKQFLQACLLIFSLNLIIMTIQKFGLGQYRGNGLFSEPAHSAIILCATYMVIQRQSQNNTIVVLWFLVCSGLTSVFSISLAVLGMYLASGIFMIINERKKAYLNLIVFVFFLLLNFSVHLDKNYRESHFLEKSERVEYAFSFSENRLTSISNGTDGSFNDRIYGGLNLLKSLYEEKIWQGVGIQGIENFIGKYSKGGLAYRVDIEASKQSHIFHITLLSAFGILWLLFWAYIVSLALTSFVKFSSLLVLSLLGICYGGAFSPSILFILSMFICLNLKIQPSKSINLLNVRHRRS